MHNLAIIFERTVNRGFADEKDKKSSRGEIVKGTRGEHIEEWRCEICDKLGWPIVGHSVQYFISKVRNGAKPIRVENAGPYPASWSDEQKAQIGEVLAYVQPLVESNTLVRESNERAKSVTEARSVGAAKGKGQQALSAEG